MRTEIACTILLTVACSCSDGPQRSRELEALAAAFEPDSLDSELRTAWGRLREMEWFGTTTSSWTWGPHEPTVDLCLLLHEGERDALLDLAFHATPAGRLWGLWGLKQVDPSSYEELSHLLANDESPVLCAGGCIVQTAPLFEEIPHHIEAEPDELRTWLVQLYPEQYPEREGRD